jgi:catalase
MSKPIDNSAQPSASQLTTTAGNPVADNQNSANTGVFPSLAA